MKEGSIGIVILAGLLVMALMGGLNNSMNGNTGQYNAGITGNQPTNQNQNTEDIARQVKELEVKVKDVSVKVQTEVDKETYSPYKGKIKIAYVNRSNDPSYEYITLRMDTGDTPIKINGWMIKSLSSGNLVTIPKGTKLYFEKTNNSEEDVYVSSGDVVYILTGRSPLGIGFKTNKCSGYLSQFQNFIPYLYTSCPIPRNENLSSIPAISYNDACLDYIESYPSCRIKTENLPANWSFECKKFIEEKIGYPNCVNLHKNDKNFYLREWRLYLNRNSILWKNRREDIVLYDNQGKIVSEIKY